MSREFCYHFRIQITSGDLAKFGEGVPKPPSSCMDSFFEVLQSLPPVRRITCMQQWHSQDEQVTWAHHGQIQCAQNMHQLGEPGHAPAMKIICSEIASKFIFGHKSTQRTSVSYMGIW